MFKGSYTLLKHVKCFGRLGDALATPRRRLALVHPLTPWSPCRLDKLHGRMFYGPGGPYALFAGRDASRALALMSFDHNDLTGNLEGLRSPELEVLQDWEGKFMEKYVKVGQLAFEGTTISGNNQNVEALPISSVEAENLVENIENRGFKAEATYP
ncbi:Membrane steroid-binding protein 2 [Platanthera guangdongensis]|uniref:Membrane steroid-binding protein 2 n=1 Tax=Platanthera guangdongensis TaxID=2320717 RepID=A0ABR2MBV8_9ASPA